jgi:hypothetical protein
MNTWLHVSHNLLNPSAEQKAACVANAAKCACSGLSDNQTTCAHQIFWSAQQDADAQIGMHAFLFLCCRVLGKKISQHHLPFSDSHLCVVSMVALVNLW